MPTPLTAYLTEQVRTDAEMRRVLELAARQSASAVRELELSAGESIGARVRQAQFQQVLAEVTRTQSDLWVGKIGPLIQRSLPRAQRAAERSFRVIEQLLEDRVGERRAAALIKSFQQFAKNGMELDRVRRVRELSPRVYKNAALANGSVERTIRAGIIQGLSPKELARNVRQHISARTPGGVSYSAMRLARTELNNAFHESQKLQAQAPWVRGVEWKLSGSHPVKSRCKCEQYATQDVHDMGPGVYPADRVPDKPHPQCLCHTTFQVMSEADLLDMLPALVEQQLA